MTRVSLIEAQESLPQLIALIQRGEEVIIAEQGKLLACLSLPRPELTQRRIPGIDKGVFIVPDDFDDPLPDDMLQDFGV